MLINFFGYNGPCGVSIEIGPNYKTRVSSSQVMEMAFEYYYREKFLKMASTSGLAN